MEEVNGSSLKQFIIAMYLAIDGKIFAADGKLWRKKAWQATLGRVAAELDQLQGSTMTNYLPAAYHFYNSPDQLEP